MSSKTYDELNGKVAIVSGARRGIGLETAKVLAGNGAKVVLADLPDFDMTESLKAAQACGEVAFHPVDISDEQSVRELMEFTVDTFGTIDILDNNAAATLPADSDLLSTDPAVWDRTFSVNARGTMLMCKHAVAHMIKHGGGSIVNISSGTSLAGQPYTIAYAASKGAINTLTKYVATQYGSQGVRCNALALGLVLTELLQSNMPDDFQQIYARNKLVGRLGRPHDIAEMVSFLASDRAAWITGQVYSVDGGFFAHSPTMDSEQQLMAAMHTSSPLKGD